MIVNTTCCPRCGIEGELFIVDEQQIEQYKNWVVINPFRRPPMKQILTSWEPQMREQLLTGFHPRCWNIAFGDERVTT